jgi:hypothetical protein
VWLALSAGALASIPLSGQLHLALGAIPFLALYALVRVTWTVVLVVPALVAGVLANLAVVRGTTGANGRSFGQVEHYSADVPDFLSRNRHEIEGLVYLGWTVLALALVGLAVLVVRRRWGLSLALGLGALVPSLLALGANLPGYETLWRHLPGLRHTRVPERLMPIACLALAALVAVAVSRMSWPGTAAIVAVFLLLDLHLGLFHMTAADEHNRAYAALSSQPAGRLLELPVFLPDDQDASVYVYYLMQAQREHPLGYSTTAPLAADAALRELQRAPCRKLETLGVRYLATHFGRSNPCGGELLRRDGSISVYRVR